MELGYRQRHPTRSETRKDRPRFRQPLCPPITEMSSFQQPDGGCTGSAQSTQLSVMHKTFHKNRHFLMLTTSRRVRQAGRAARDVISAATLVVSVSPYGGVVPAQI